jgi:hypothetical protein
MPAAEGAPSVLALQADSWSILIAPAPGDALASDIRTLETYSIQRTITQPLHDAACLLADALGRKGYRRAAVEGRRHRR